MFSRIFSRLALQVEIRYWEAAFVSTLSLVHPFVYTKFYHLEAGGQRKYPTTEPKIKGLNLRTCTAGEKNRPTVLMALEREMKYFSL